MLKEKIGPTEYHSYRCGVCKFHISNMIHSGMKPLYHHYCRNPKTDTDVETDFMSDDDSPYIGETDATPAWCPEMRDK